MTNIIENTCCFFGHRSLPKKRFEYIIKRLDLEIDNLINQGVTNFISGGELGFEQIAASIVLVKREMGANVRLILALPCQNQDKKLTAGQKRLYHTLLSEASEVRYVVDDCMKKRDYSIVDNASYCICYFTNTNSHCEAAQTLRYAEQKGLTVRLLT